MNTTHDILGADDMTNSERSVNILHNICMIRAEQEGERKDEWIKQRDFLKSVLDDGVELTISNLNKVRQTIMNLLTTNKHGS